MLNIRKGRLFLIPVPLGPVPADIVLPSAVQNRAKSLTHFIAENAKSARAFLKSLPSDTPLQQIEICELNEHTSHTMLPDLLTPLHAGSAGVDDRLSYGADRSSTPKRPSSPTTSSGTYALRPAAVASPNAVSASWNWKRSRPAGTRPRSSSKPPIAIARCWRR